MSLTFQQLLNYSWMSQASYLNFDGSRSLLDELKSSPINKANEFADKQAQEFINPTNGFNFVSHQVNTASGFSATVFKSPRRAYPLAVRRMKNGVRVDY